MTNEDKMKIGSGLKQRKNLIDAPGLHHASLRHQVTKKYVQYQKHVLKLHGSLIVKNTHPLRTISQNA
jgi:hypothetical protein